MQDAKIAASTDSVSITPCAICVHKYANQKGCAAFGDVIPTRILLGDVEHNKAIPGDNGLQFERAQG